MRTAIVLSTYNNEDIISKCINSCLKQPDVMIFCSDDGSKDATGDILKQFESENDNVFVDLLEHGERGIARATAIKKARTHDIDFIYIIDSDMILADNLVGDCVDFLNRHDEVGALVIPERPFSTYDNFYSKVKVFERTVLNDAGDSIGLNSIEAARFWKMNAYEKSGGINSEQIAFEETQPTIRYLEKGGVIKRAVFTGVDHDEKMVTLKNIVNKKRYYFSVMNKTIETETGGTRKAFQRFYFFRPVLYRKSNLKRYLKHPLLTLGMTHMYFVLSWVAVWEILKKKFSHK